VYPNRRRARACVSDDTVMRDATMEMCDLCISVLHAGTSPLRVSHVVVEDLGRAIVAPWCYFSSYNIIIVSHYVL
jgi:hypothetical protein